MQFETLTSCSTYIQVLIQRCPHVRNTRISALTGQIHRYWTTESNNFIDLRLEPNRDSNLNLNYKITIFEVRKL